jgi:hypothetical protein
VASARAALDAAKRLAEHARRLGTEAAETCVRAIDAASGGAIEPRSFSDKLADGFRILWDAICETAKWATLVVGVIAIMAAGADGRVVLVANAVAIAGTVAVAEGAASVQHLVFAILGAVPGIRGHTTVGPLRDSFRDGGTRVIGAAAGAAMRARAVEMLAVVRGAVADAAGPGAPAPAGFLNLNGSPARLDAGR